MPWPFPAPTQHFFEGESRESLLPEETERRYPVSVVDRPGAAAATAGDGDAESILQGMSVQTGIDAIPGGHSAEFPDSNRPVTYARKRCLSSISGS